MSKRKLDINQVKKLIVKNRSSSKAAKYETVFSYFKQKESRDMDMFSVKLPLLIRELLETLTTYDLFSKLGTKQQVKAIDLSADEIMMQTIEIKGLKSEYPIKELLSCMFIKKQQGEKKAIVKIGVLQNKLIHFFKKLREIYEQFCIGDKLLLQQNQYTSFYEAFKSEWTRKQQKGRQSNLERLQKRLVRCLFVFILLVENNILKTIDNKEKKQLQQNAQFGTKSEKKNITKYNSAASSKNSTELISNFSLKPLSQHSYDELQQNHKSDLQQKSLDVNLNNKQTLFDKALVGNLKFKIETIPFFQEELLTAPFINLLEDGVQNVLVEQAFRSCARKRKYSQQHQNQNMFMNMYSGVHEPIFMNSLYNYPHNYSQQYIPTPIQVPLMNLGMPYGAEDMQLHQLRRSMDFFSPIPMGMNMNKGVKSQISTPKTPRGNKSNKSINIRHS